MPNLLFRPVVKRLGPTFDETNYGCRSFADLLKKHDGAFKIGRGRMIIWCV